MADRNGTSIFWFEFWLIIHPQSHCLSPGEDQNHQVTSILLFWNNRSILENLLTKVVLSFMLLVRIHQSRITNKGSDSDGLVSKNPRHEDILFHPNFSRGPWCFPSNRLAVAVIAILRLVFYEVTVKRRSRYIFFTIGASQNKEFLAIQSVHLPQVSLQIGQF